jgi:acyl carrier protein
MLTMTLSEMSTSERVYAALQEHIGGDVELSPDTDLLQDLGMDSLEQVELGLKLEKLFAIKLTIADLRTCMTVDEIVQLVQRTLSQSGVQTHE